MKDASNAVVPNATVKATNTDTGVQEHAVTNGQGFYSFPDLPIGRYNLVIQRTGFKPYQRTGVTIDADSAVIVDVVLEIGEQAQVVTVSESAVHAETSDTQMGEVIGSAKMASIPLNGRSYTDLLALQPGVVPVTSLTSSTQQDVGVIALSPSGGLNPGTISINGQREFSNAFIVNGADAEEDVNSGTAIIPNLDSIAEFRILTGNFDAEHGGYSGGQINVVTKSGTNEFHGDAFEFLRNTNLDSRNYFSPTRGAFDQNQWGGTFGGALRRNKAFFFADYQGTRLTQGVDTRSDPGSFRSRSNWQSIRSGKLAYGHSHRPALGEPAFAGTRISRFCRRALLHARMHEFLPMCFPEWPDPSFGMVRASEKSAAIHPPTEHGNQHVLDLGRGRAVAG